MSVHPVSAEYPPPPQYVPPQAVPTAPTTVVVTQPVVTLVQHFRETPVRTKCMYCHADVVTATSFEVGNMTWVACAVLCFIGCDMGCCFIPFCVNACKDVVHHCPNCNQQLGRYNRM